MGRTAVRIAVLGAIFLLLGVASAAAVFAFVPNPGSPPSIFDDFNYASTSSGFWHVNAIGGKAIIKDGLLTLSGHSVELDHRLQTDPYRTVAVAKVRGRGWDKFALGLGVYHSGTMGVEFDNDGAKCGWPTDHGWKIDYLKGWKTPPTRQWFYLVISVTNPFPNVPDLTPEMELKHPVTIICSLYDGSGRQLARVHPVDPPPNAHYASLDEAFVRTWDSHNRYEVDWIYAGPPSGSPIKSIVR
jgi:hypothetical protein